MPNAPSQTQRRTEPPNASGGPEDTAELVGQFRGSADDAFGFPGPYQVDYLL